MTNKYFDGIVNNTNISKNVDEELIDYASRLNRIVEEKMNDLKVSEAIEAIIELFRKCNKYIDLTEPWILAKNDEQKERLSTVLYNLIESIRIGAILLQAFIPETSKKILSQINAEDIKYEDAKVFGKYKNGTKLNKAEILFARIEKKEQE